MLKACALLLMLSVLALAFIAEKGAIEATSSLSLDARRVFVTIPLACMPGEKVDLEVSLNQAFSGADGTGFRSGTCSGGVQKWTAEVAAVAEGFAPGPAHACAVSRLYQEGAVIDARRWCRGITVVSHEGHHDRHNTDGNQAVFRASLRAKEVGDASRYRQSVRPW